MTDPTPLSPALRFSPSPPRLPLYRKLQQELDLYGSNWPPKLAMIIDLIADEVERRGQIDYDRDPGETSDWLRREASFAREEISIDEQ